MSMIARIRDLRRPTNADISGTVLTRLLRQLSAVLVLFLRLSTRAAIGQVSGFNALD